MSRLTSLTMLVGFTFTLVLALVLMSQPVAAQSESPLLTEWIENTSVTAPNFSGVLVNVQSVVTVTINGVDYVRVRASGIPSYQTVITTTDLTALNTRSLRTTGLPDFSNGVQGSSNGTSPLNLNDVVDFGDDVGYINTTCTMKYWPYGPVCPEEMEREVYFPLTPSPAATPAEFLDASVIGTLVNGTALYNWSDAMSYNGGGVWDNVASKFELYDMDICPGHAANGDYHHHFYPKCLAAQLGDNGTAHSPIYGFAADGYPIYGPYTGNATLAQSGWTTRNYADTSSTSTGCPGPNNANKRVCLLTNQYTVPLGQQSQYTQTTPGPMVTATVTSQSNHTFTAASGYYFQDYYYNTNCSGCLDLYNGHTHDSLGYHYHFTLAADGATPAFPFSVGPKFYGELHSNALTNNYVLQAAKTGTGSGTVTSDPDGISCGATCGTVYTYRTITLTATADTGSTFAGWSGNCTGGSTTCTVTLDASKSVTATFSAYACHVEYTGDSTTDFQSNDASAIQDAVDAASAGATIKIAGTCAGVEAGSAVPQTVSITKNLTLEGGHTITNWAAAADSDAYPTTLDANLGGRVVEVNSGVTATIKHLYLTDGYAYAGGTLYSGGNVYNTGNLTIEYSTINNGKAYYGGGVHNTFNSGAQTTIRYSTLSNNYATHSGGGAYSGETNGSMTIINSTISGNKAHYNGGGVGAGTGTVVTITFSTVATNTADYNNNGGNGGGIGQFGTGVVTLMNTLVADNVDITPTNGAPDCVEEGVSGSGGIFSSGYNFIESITGCALTTSTGDVTNTSITLNTLADNGGYTWTHSLPSGSGASNKISSGTNGCNTTYTTDQRGTSSYPRLQGTNCDIGAYEGS